MMRVLSLVFLVVLPIFSGSIRLRKEQPNILYAAMISSEKTMTEFRLLSAYSTWAKVPVQENRTIVVVDKGFNYSRPLDKFSNIVSSDCSPAYVGQSCKHGFMLAEAARRDPDWLIVHHDDMYLVTDTFEKYLKNGKWGSPDEAVALTFQPGCGMKDPIVEHVCPQVFEKGGYCGTSPLILSRAAVKQLLNKGEDALIQEYKGYGKSAIAEDQADGCALLERGVPIKVVPKSLFTIQHTCGMEYQWLTNGGENMLFYVHNFKTENMFHNFHRNIGLWTTSVVNSTQGGPVSAPRDLCRPPSCQCDGKRPVLADFPAAGNVILVQ